MGRMGFKEAETGGTALRDKPRSGRTCSTMMAANVLWVMHWYVCSKQCITVDELCFIVSIVEGSVISIIEVPGYSKVDAFWLTWMVTDAYKSVLYRGCDKFWVDSLLHLPNSPDFVPSDYHLFGPLKTIMTVRGTEECHAPICHKGERASFTRHEHVCASHVEEVCWQVWRPGWKITVHPTS
jgi:hypothetical protein